jgi:hypothetical protein
MFLTYSIIVFLLKNFIPFGDEAIGEWRKLHNKELHDLYSWPNIIRIIESRTRWAGQYHEWGKTGTRIGCF